MIKISNEWVKATLANTPSELLGVKHGTLIKMSAFVKPVRERLDRGEGRVSVSDPATSTALTGVMAELASLRNSRVR